MKVILGLIIAFVAFNLVVLGTGVAIGFLLRWVIPSVDLNAAVLVGVLSTMTTLYLFTQMAQLIRLIHLAEDEDEDYDEDDEDEDDEDDEDEDDEDDEDDDRGRSRFPPPSGRRRPGPGRR